MAERHAPLIISGAAVWPGGGAQLIDPGAVVIVGDRIAAVGYEADLARLLAQAGVRLPAGLLAPEQAARDREAPDGGAPWGGHGDTDAPDRPALVRAPGHTLLPGFIDSHVHLHWSAGASFLREATETPEEELLLAMARNAQSALRAGVTTVRDCGSRGVLALRLRDAIHKGVIVGPRILACGPAVTITGGRLWFLGTALGTEADTPDELRRAVRRLGKAGVDAIKICATGGGTPGTSNRRAQYTAGELRVAVAEAHWLGLRVAAHCHATEGIRAVAEAGVDTAEHASWYAADAAVGLEFDEAAAGRLAANGAFHDITITDGDRVALDGAGVAALPPTPRRQLALREARYPLFRRMAELGVRQMVCTDAGYTRDWGPQWSQTLRVLVERAGYSTAAVLAMATSTAAAALGLGAELGSIAPTKIADLVLVAGDPLQDIGCAARVMQVYRAGALVAGARQVT